MSMEVPFNFKFIGRAKPAVAYYFTVNLLNTAPYCTSLNIDYVANSS